MHELPFWFHQDASAEVLIAHNRYFEVAAKLAEDFQNELERSRLAIARSGNTWPAYLLGTRGFLMKRFPYFIVYRLTDSRIEIIALAHERQRPGYWSDRT
ncbi:MAG: toxin ParE1/3/4 [Pirellulaceae bacterium]|jgi:toxin ParE1/3/4